MVKNWEIIGHVKIIEFLEKAMANGRLAQTYLFYGQRSLGKATLAQKFANILLETKEAQSTDLYPIEPLPGKKNIAIEQIREWRQKLKLKAFHSGYKVGIIDQAEKLNLESANALLKTIEEPSENTIIIIVASSWEKILPTIVSRSQLIRFSPVSKNQILNSLGSFYEPDKLETIINLIGGYPGLVINYLNNPALFQEFLNFQNIANRTFGSNLVDKFQYVESLLEKPEEFNQKISIALEFIRHLKIVLRSLLINYYKNNGASASQPKRHSPREMVLIGEKIQEAERQLLGNGQPRLVLENLMLNI